MKTTNEIIEWVDEEQGSFLDDNGDWLESADDVLNKVWFSEEEVYDKITQLKYFVGNMRFKMSNESLTKFYDKIKELRLEK